MAESAEQLVVLLEAKVNDFERNMKRALKSANDNFGGIEDRGRRMGRNLERDLASSTARINATMGKMGTGAGSAFGTSLKASIAGAMAGVSIGQIAEYSDTDVRARNALKVAGLEGEALKKTYDELFVSAQKNAVPLEAMTTLYGRLSMSQKELKVNSADIARFTDGVAVALKVSGQSATEASGALLQLAQAMGGGKIQAEEYNSLIDGARPVLMAVAAGMVEAGGSVSKLTQLVKDGKVSSEAFFRAFEAGRPMLDDLASKTAPTLAQELTRVQNALVAAAGEMSRMAGATDSVRSAFQGLIDLIAQAPEIFKRDLADLAKIAAVAESIANTIRTAAGTTAIIKDPPGEESGYEPLVMRIKPRAPNVELDDTETKAPPPVSLKSYPVPGDKAGGSGGKSGADRINDFEREVQALEKRTRAIDEETAAVGKSSLEAARAEAQFKLLEAAKAANLPITDELRSKVDALAGAYAAAKVKLEEAQAAQRAAQEQSRFLGQELTDAIGDLVIEGNSLSDVFDNLAKNLAKAALQAALLGNGPLGGIFGTAAPSGGGLGGLLGSLFGGVKLADGGAVRGPGTSRSDSIPAMLSDGEFVINARSTAKHRALLEAINSGRALHLADGGPVGRRAPAIPSAGIGSASARGGQVIHVAPQITVQATGGSPAANADLAAQIGQQIDGVMRSTIAQEMRQALRPGGLFDHARR